MNGKPKYDSSAPAIDEGWWESVLTEEAKHSAGIQRTGSHQPEFRVEAAPSPVNWDHIRELYMNDCIVSLTVTGHNRGGLLVEGENLSGFVPLSHLVALAGKDADGRAQDFESYLGVTLRLKVIECAPEDGRVVFSERAAQSEPGKRAELFHSLHAGQRANGTVTNITDFGVFVDLGGVEGLIHISELSWGRVNHPTQFVHLGGTIDVQVLELAPERCRVALSLKRILPNPWVNAEREFPIGSIHAATVTSVLSYGVFARLDQYGVEGLAHVSEIPHHDGAAIKEFLSEGQPIQVRILRLDTERCRLGFSMRFE